MTTPVAVDPVAAAAEAATVMRADEDKILRASPHEHEVEDGRPPAMERYSEVCHASYCDFCDEWLEGTPYVVPQYLGPTWHRGPDGRFVMPQNSLGPMAILWMYTWLQLAGSPFIPTYEQARFICWMYAVDHRGRFIYRDITLQRLKGWGKDPLAAALCLFELLGPCRFDRWAVEADVKRGLATRVGAPIGREETDAWVQVFGVAEAGTVNTMGMLPQLITDKLKAKASLDVNKSIIYAYGARRRLEAVSSNWQTREGNRPTFQIGGEPHHWNAANAGHDLAGVMVRNSTKIKGGQSRILWITNAYDSSRESVGKAARDAYDDVLAGAADSGIMYDSLEAPPSARLIEREIPVVLESVRGDATWLDIETITKTILDGRTTPNESRRFYYNQIVADEEGYFRPKDIEATRHPTVKAWRTDPDVELDLARLGWPIVDPRDEIVVFFDGGKSGDSTAISGCRLSDGYTFVIGHWRRPPKRETEKEDERWNAPRHEVDHRMREAKRRFNVVAIYADPSHAKDDEGDAPYWMPIINGWHRDWKDELEQTVWPVKTGKNVHSVLFDMAIDSNQAIFVPAAKLFAQAITEHEIQHDGHPMAENNMRNARQGSSKHGMTMVKRNRKSPYKIDQAITHAGAYMLRDLVLNARVEAPPGSGELW